MNLSNMQRAAVSGLILSVILAGCGSSGGGGSTVTPTMGGTSLLGSGSNTTVTFGNFAMGPLAIGESRSISPAESGYTGTFTAASSNTGVVTVTPASGAAPFVLKGIATGTATVTFTDTAGHSGAVNITVSSIGFGDLSTAAFAVGEARSLTPTEPGYTGTFTVTSSNPGVISVSPASGTGPFTLTAVAVGTTTITVTDSNGNMGSTTLTVAAAGTVPTAAPVTATSAPTTVPTTVATTGPGGTPTTAPTTVPTTVPTTAPTTAPTATPTKAPTAAPTTAPTAAPTTAPTPTPTPTASPVPIVVTGGTSVSLGGIANATVTLPGGGSLANVSVTSSNPSVATAVNLGNGNFSVVGNGVGTSNLVYADGNGHSLTVGVTVPSSTPPLTLSPSALNLSASAGPIHISTVSVSDPTNLLGTLTVQSSNTGVFTAVQVLNQVIVTGVGPGTGILTVTDANGNVAHLALSVQ